MGSASMNVEEDTRRYDDDPVRHVEIISQLQDVLPFLWIAVPDTAGISVMLLSRVEEKSIQRRIHFSWCGEEKISVHGKPIPRALSDSILRHDKPDNAISPTGRFSLTVQHILTVVERLRSYEVCVGVDDARFKLFWGSDKCGDIDKNPFGELRYKETFRPSNCHLLVSTSGHLKRSCPACIETKMRFKKRKWRHDRNISHTTTRNNFLSRDQLLEKVQTQEKKLKSKRAQISKLKSDLQMATLRRGLSDKSLSEELTNICMAFVQHHS